MGISLCPRRRSWFLGFRAGRNRGGRVFSRHFRRLSHRFFSSPIPWKEILTLFAFSSSRKTPPPSRLPPSSPSSDFEPTIQSFRKVPKGLSFRSIYWESSRGGGRWSWGYFFWFSWWGIIRGWLFLRCRERIRSWPICCHRSRLYFPVVYRPVSYRWTAGGCGFYFGLWREAVVVVLGWCYFVIVFRWVGIFSCRRCWSVRRGTVILSIVLSPMPLKGLIFVYSLRICCWRTCLFGSVRTVLFLILSYVLSFYFLSVLHWCSLSAHSILFVRRSINFYIVR